MPLGALPPETTARYFIDYQQGTAEHTLLIRVAPSVGLSQFDPVMTNVFTAVSSLLCLTTITGVRFAARSQTFSNPVPSGLAGQNFGTGTPIPQTNSSYLDFVGRSNTGRRARITFFGVDVSLSDFRLTAGESTIVDTLVSTFNDALDMFLAIDGSKPTFKSYANTGVNSYWTRELRT